MIITSDIYLRDRDIMRCGVGEEISGSRFIKKDTVGRKGGVSFNVFILFRKKMEAGIQKPYSPAWYTQRNLDRGVDGYFFIYFFVSLTS